MPSAYRTCRIGPEGQGRVANGDPRGDQEIEWTHIVFGEDIPAEFADELASSRHTFSDLEAGHMRSGVLSRGSRISFLYMAILNRDTYVPIAFFLEPNRLLTVARSPVPLLDELQDEWVEDPDDFGRNVGSITYTVLDAITDAYFPVLDDMHNDIEEIEERLYGKEAPQMSEILALKRDLLVMRKQIAPLRDNVNLLVRLGFPIITEESKIAFTDLYNHLLRLNDSIDVGRDLLSGILDAQLGIVSKRLNEVMRTMTVISTTLMVGALVAGIYGMNFHHMPELAWPGGYAYALALMFSLMGLTVWLFRRNGYF